MYNEHFFSCRIFLHFVQVTITMAVFFIGI